MPFFEWNNTRAMQAYQVMRAGAGIFTGIFLAKSSLSTAEIGVWESLLFVGALVIFTGVNGFLQGVSPVYVALPEPERPRFFLHVLAIFTAIGAVIALILLLGAPWLIPALTGLQQLPAFTFFAVYLFFNVSTLPVEVWYLLQQRPWAILAWGLFGFGGQILGVCIPVFMGWGIQTAVYGWCLLAALKFIWTTGLAVRHMGLSPFNAATRSYLKRSFPLALNSFTGNLVALFDGWLVGNWFANPTTFALYRYGSREFPWSTALATALGTAAVPNLVADRPKGLEALRGSTLRMLHAVMPVTFVLILAAPWLFRVVFSPAFVTAAGLFQIYLLVTPSRVLLPSAVLVALGETRIIFFIGLAELALKVVTGLLFIQWWGLHGVAWSVVLCNCFEKGSLLVYLWWRKGVPPQAWLPWRWYVGYTVLLLLGFWAAQ